MFAPDGYVQLLEVFQSAGNLAADSYPSEYIEDSFDTVPDFRPELYQKLIFYRFLDAHLSEIWIFKFPDIIFRATSDLLYRARQYFGPCPDDQEAARTALEHISCQPMTFVTDRFRIKTNIEYDDAKNSVVEEMAVELEPLEGAILLWKPSIWPIDIERSLWPFQDDIYFRGHPGFDPSIGKMKEADGLKATFEEFIAVCPHGKKASKLTWTEIEKRTGWSRRNINRAIDVHGGQTDGQVSGQQQGK